MSSPLSLVNPRGAPVAFWTLGSPDPTTRGGAGPAGDPSPAPPPSAPGSGVFLDLRA